MVAWAIPLSTVAMVSVLAFLALIYSEEDPFLQTLYILAMVLFGALEIMVFLFYQSLFGKSWHKIVFYDNGIQFPKCLWDRMRGRVLFLAKDRIVSVRASFITDPRMVGSNTAELIFGSIDGKSYRTGYRAISDINSFSIWLGTEWQMKVERTDLRGNPIASPHKVRVVASPETRTCLGCGYSFTDDLGFCPSCGRMITKGMDPLDPFAPRMAKEPPSIIHSPPAQYEQPGTPGDYPRPGQNPPYLKGNQFQTQDVPAPLSLSDGYGSYPLMQPTNLRGKSPRLAMILAGVPGLLGVMGMGHIYMGKYLKGFILLILGGFLALLSLASIILVFMPDEFSLGAKVVTAAILSAPFLGLFLWQLFDAPKPTGPRPVQDPNGYLRPPYGP